MDIFQYDIDKLHKAREMLMIPLNYYYGEYYSRRFWKRLETIISKLDELIVIAEENSND